jgi:hypothetical protein
VDEVEEEEGVEHLEEREGGAWWVGVVDWLWKSQEEREEPRNGKCWCSVGKVNSNHKKLSQKS